MCDTQPLGRKWEFITVGLGCIMWCYVMLCEVILCYVKSRYNILYYTMLYYTMPLYTTTLYYIMPYYIMLYYIVETNRNETAGFYMCVLPLLAGIFLFGYWLVCLLACLFVCLFLYLFVSLFVWRRTPTHLNGSLPLWLGAKQLKHIKHMCLLNLFQWRMKTLKTKHQCLYV